MSRFNDEVEEVSSILMKGIDNPAIKGNCVKKVFSLDNGCSFRFKKEYLNAKDKDSVYWKYAVPSNDYSRTLESRYCKRKDRKQGWWD